VNVFISADMEGVCGIRHWEQAEPRLMDYELGREWMALDVNAAVEGALRAGATRIVVRDAHNEANNIRPDKLHPAAELISGWGPLSSMVEGVDESFDAVFLVGYHARACTDRGTLAHTWSSNVLELALDGRPIGEAFWSAAFAGHFGVPVALVTGDDLLKEQVEQELPPGVHYVITKTGMGHKCARLRPPADARDEIRDTAAAALDGLEGLTPLRPEWPATLSIRFRHWEHLSAVEAIPGVRRTGIDSFACRPSDMIEAQRYFITMHRLGRLPQ